MKKTEKINKSRLMKRAWYLVKQKCFSISYALVTVWKEIKEAIKESAVEIIEYSGSIFNPTPEIMAEYYNSNCYKAD